MLPPKKRLLDQVHIEIWLKNTAYRTEKSYLYWIKPYILFHKKRHPNEMRGAQISSNFSPISPPRKLLPHQLKTHALSLPK